MADDRVQIPKKPTVREDFASTQFGEQLVAGRSPNFHLESQNGTSVLRDTTSTTNAGAITGTNGLIKLSTSTNSNDDAQLTTNQAGEYGAGKEAEAKIALAIDGTPTDDQYVEWGYRNADNGIFYRYDADGLHYYLRRAGTDIDLEGSSVDSDAVLTGADVDLSASSVDTSILTIYGIPFAWYGAGGDVRGTIEQPRDLALRQRKPHEQTLFKYQPHLDDQLGVGQPFVETPNLPIDVEVSNGGTAPGSGLDVYVGGRQFSVIGKQRISRVTHHEAASVTVGTTRAPVFALRPVQTFNGRENSVNVRLAGLQASSSGNVRLAVDVNAEVSESYSTPARLASDETAVETAYTTDGTLTESSAGMPNGLVQYLRAGAGSQSSGVAGADVTIPLGITQSAVIYAVAESSAVDIELAPLWTESRV